MADPVLFKIFLSSPGDVPQERDDAQAVIDEINDSHEFDHHFLLKLYRWDDPGVALPMAVHDIPQKSVDIYMTLPSACDLVVVLFWSRMGSPLVMDEREYLSGTHYEYSEALQGYEQKGKPTVWLYRCAEKFLIDLDAPKRDEKIQQYDRVSQFFKQFQDAEGRYTGGVNSYGTHADFKALFKGQLLTYLRHLRDNPRREDKPAAPVKRPFTGVPYRGLNALDEGDASIFFGREAETLEVQNRVESKRLAFVLGASGSGKSSLVAAGVLPRLRKHEWRIVRCVPGDDPFGSVAKALVSQMPELGVKPIDYLSESQRLAATLGQSPANLVDQITMMLPNTRVLLFIDQFEETFTLADKNPNLAEGTVQTFIQAIRQPSATVTTLLTMRADFYGTALPHFEELKQQAYGLTRPSPFALYEMITRPAELAGLTLDSGLAQQIVNDLGSESGALALMSYVLETLYLRAKERGDRRLSRRDYEVELNGVRGAINTLADRAYAELPFDEAIRQKALQCAFRELIAMTEDDGQMIPTRRRAPLATFRADSNEAKLIEVFVHARLLVKDSHSVEVAHEAVFRSWERLRNWITEAQEDLILLRQVKSAADEWERKDRPDFLRWPAERLKPVYEMIERQAPPLDEHERDFIEPEQERLLREIEDIHTDHKRRHWIGERLGIVGDPRFGIGVDKHRIPQIDWLPIISGGSIEIDTKHFVIQPFCVARYLITYRQYQAFLDAFDGFSDYRWWNGMPDKYVMQETVPSAAQYDNYPRGSVSWYQSIAFSRWLDFKYREHQLFASIPSDFQSLDKIQLDFEQWQIRLPTEWEWQWMAQGGTESRNYPWGDWDDIPRANTTEAGLSKHSTAVGMYPAGAGVCGAMDLSGNLWEWCLNNYVPIEVVNLGDSQEKALRGGSYVGLRKYHTSSFRGKHAPENNSNRAFGLRLICTPSRIDYAISL